MLSWLAENYLTVLTSGLAIIGGSSVIVAALDKLLPADVTVDNKILAVLGKVQGFLSRVALNKPSE